MELLAQLRREQSENVASYNYNGVTIKNKSLYKGIKYYDLARRLCMLDVLEKHDAALPDSTTGSGKWVDLLGLLAPEADVNALIDDILRGEISDINDVAAILKETHDRYAENKWAWAYNKILDFANLDSLTEEDRDKLIAELKPARQEWLNAIRYDAEREYELGDVDEDTLKSFIGKIK